MRPILSELADEYCSEVRQYVREPDEARLSRAYEFGRKALAEGVGVLEMATIHGKALESVLGDEGRTGSSGLILQRAAELLLEVLSPFEIALRGYQEANSELRTRLEELRLLEEELRNQNDNLATTGEAIDLERRRYRDLFEFAPDAYLVTDLQANIQEANSAAGKLFKRRPQSLASVPLAVFVSRKDHRKFYVQLASLKSSGVDDLQDWHMTLRADQGGHFPAAVTVRVVRDAEDRPSGLRWLVRDITEQKRAEEERTRLLAREQAARAEAEAAGRLRFLVEASTALTVSLDYAVALSNVARLAVPYLADYCAIDVVEESGEVRRVGVVYADPAGAEALLRLDVLQQNDPGQAQGVASVLRTGQSEIYTEVPDSWLASAAGNAEPGLPPHETGPKSAVFVAMVLQEQVLGAISLVSVGSGRRFGPADLALAEALARRCAVAVDNARLYQQLIVERDKAEKASRAKDEFLAVLSHEIRNPLMPIIGWARILKTHKEITGNKVLSEAAQSLERNAQNMVRLVDDCLDITRITERKITIERESIDLNQVAAAAVEAIAELARAKNIEFRVKLAPKALCFLGDRTRLEQVVLNLLTNAIKYTDSGGSISVTSRNVEDEVELLVEDTGTGIAPDFLEQIFEPFRQGTANWLTSESGLGLGLTIARRIVQMHGGRIWAESEGIGRGSRFYLRLPFVSAEATRSDVDLRPATAPAKARPLRILLIEDAEDILALMKLELEWLGYTVLTARDGISGLELAQREALDLIVSDIKMPGMDGYDLIKELRRIPKLASTPAIALTGFGMKRDTEAALAAGYNAHLCKPVDAKQLSAVIEQLAAKQL